MPEYRIKDWKQKYENHRTRELAQMSWVPIPNKMDGIGYTELVEHSNGASHFGAWIAIVEIASRQDPRGTLPTVRGSTSIALSRLSRIPASVFDEVLPRLLSEEIGWIEEVSAQQEPDAAPEVALAPRSTAHDRAKAALYRTEWNRREEKEEESAPQRGAAASPPVPFPDPAPTDQQSRELEAWVHSVYSRHPKKKNKFLAEQSLVKRFCRDPVNREVFDKNHALWCETDAWKEKNGAFAPALHEFVADDGWKYPPIQPSKQAMGARGRGMMADLLG